jgi:uncharacterized membrane protein YeaQ/YmgE (transglycosylase-associated protein family)
VELAITIGLGGWILLVAAAVIFGVAAQAIGETRTGYEWFVDAIGFGLGALVASEFIVALQTFAPVWDGLALVPALIGGLAAGLVVEVTTRFVTHGTYTHQPMSV